MELILNSDSDNQFLANLIRNSHDLCLCSRDSLLCPTAGNESHIRILGAPVDVNLVGSSVVLDLIDSGAVLAEDASDSSSWYGEFNDVVSFLFELDRLRKSSA